MKRIVYTGPIADAYQGELRWLLMDYGFEVIRARVDNGHSCERRVVVLDVESRTAWVEYVSEDISEYNEDNAVFTCSIEEVKDTIESVEDRVWEK